MLNRTHFFTAFETQLQNLASIVALADFGMRDLYLGQLQTQNSTGSFYIHARAVKCDVAVHVGKGWPAICEVDSHATRLGPEPGYSLSKTNAAPSLHRQQSLEVALEVSR